MDGGKGLEPGGEFKEIAPHCHVHGTAVIEEGVTFEGRVLVGANARVGAHSRLSGVVCLGERTIVAPGATSKMSLPGLTNRFLRAVMTGLFSGPTASSRSGRC